MSSNGQASTGKSVKRQACILAAASLALLVNLVAVILAVYVMTSLKQPAHSQTTEARSSRKLGPIACITCDWQSGEILKTLTVTKVNDTAMLCCAESTSQMSALMELILRNQEVDRNTNLRPEPLDDTLESLKAGNFSFSKASAHKRLQTKEIFNSSIDKVPVFRAQMLDLTLNASYHKVDKEHVRGVEVLESGFRITQPGTYHVYSSVQFKPDSSNPCSSFQFKVWEHKVMKTSKQQATELVKSVHTCCDKCSADRETSFASGVFLLEAGDHLGVRISGLGLISYYCESSYFGLLMLGSSRT
ncbi:hypothetical protein BsWGS_22114 [Bradybaena similaris]